MNETRPGRNYLCAAAAAAVGAYFFAVGAHLLPIPGGPSNLHGPSWLVLCVGLAFLLAGVALLIQTLGHANTAGELPADAPRWLRAVQYLIGFTIFCCFGATRAGSRSVRANGIFPERSWSAMLRPTPRSGAVLSASLP